MQKLKTTNELCFSMGTLIHKNGEINYEMFDNIGNAYGREMDT